jgi:4-amino-4-deoxychorismate lyase
MRFKLISDLDLTPHPDLADRGLHYGDGLFETLLLQQGKIKYWQQHYSRLSSGCERLKINCPPEHWFERNLQPYFQLNQDLILKMIVTRGSGGRGLQIPESQIPNIYLLHYKYNYSPVFQAIRAYISEITLPKSRILAGIKHLNRLHYVLATEELKHRSAYNEALLCDDSASVVESIVSNLFIVKNNIVSTPDLSFCGVDGIMRQQVIKKLEQWGNSVKIENCSRQAILSADECFLTNSVQGIRGLIQVEDKHFPLGPITQSLQQEFHGIQSN